MTELTIYPDTGYKGKFQIEVSDITILSGTGITKDKHSGNLNCYYATKKAIEKLKTVYNFVEKTRF